MHIAQEHEPRGAHLENLVLSDLLAWRDIRLDHAGIFHWRTVGSEEEVDFVIETADGLLPIEVKATARPRLGDASNLRLFRQEYGEQARSGLLLHTGEDVEWITPDVLAVPWWRVLRSGTAGRAFCDAASIKLPVSSPATVSGLGREALEGRQLRV